MIDIEQLAREHGGIPDRSPVHGTTSYEFEADDLRAMCEDFYAKKLGGVGVEAVAWICGQNVITNVVPGYEKYFSPLVPAAAIAALQIKLAEQAERIKVLEAKESASDGC